MKLAKVILALAIASLGSAAHAAPSDLHLVMLKGNNASVALQNEVDALGGTITYSHEVGIVFVTGLSDAAAAQLATHRNVQEMVMDQTFDLDEPLATDTAAVEASVASPGDPTTAARYARQWNMRAISADSAWAAGRTGSSDITVAILDTGIDYTYPDLEGRVDLDRSVSFEAFDDLLTDFYFPGKHPVTDLHYHGTHVASTVVSNSNVIAGVTTETTLIGVKVCSVFGSCPFSSVIAGVLHAADAGADIANMSLGGGFTKAGNGIFVGFINQVFNYANSKGTLVVVAAGNSAIDMDHDRNTYNTYCNTPSTVCVSATGPSASDDSRAGPWYGVDDLAGYSNYGRSAISVAAPGGTGAGLVWAACSQTSLQIPVCGTGTFILGLGGTSMASPHAAGVAALIAEDVGRNPARIKTKLQETADDLGQPGTDPAYGKGRINAYNAVNQ